MRQINRNDFLAMTIYLELRNNFYMDFESLTESIRIKYPNYFKKHKNKESIKATIRGTIYFNSKDSESYNTVKDRDMFRSVFGKGEGIWDSNPYWKLDKEEFNVLLNNVLNSGLLSLEENQLVNYYNDLKKEALILKLYDKYCLQ